MRRSFLAVVAAVFSLVLLSTSGAYSGTFPFGDEPYRANLWHDPEIATGCLKWNWQQHHWNDYCVFYVHPKAYIYPRASRTVLRSRG